MTPRYFFKNYRRAYRLSRWFRGRISLSGRLLLGAIVASGVFGLDVRRSLAYQMLALGISILLVAMIGTAFVGRRFEIRRVFPPFASCGQRFTYDAEIKNIENKASSGATLRERINVELPTFEAFRAAREPGHSQQNRLERYFGYGRWAWLTRNSERVAPGEFSVPPLKSGETARISLALTPQRRGRISSRGLSLHFPEPLGIARRVVEVSRPGSVLVLPLVIPLPTLALGSGGRRQVSGMVDRNVAGEMGDLKGLREFRPGDSMRRIDWRASARMGEPLVKEFHDQDGGGLAVFLDTDAPEHSERFEHAVTAAASLISATPHGDPAELVLVHSFGSVEGEQDGEMLRVRGRESALITLASLAAAPLSIEVQLRAVTRMVPPDAVIVVLQGWDASRSALTEALRRRTSGPVVPVFVTDSDERFSSEIKGEPIALRVEHLAADLSEFARRAQFLVRQVA